ncbi:monooxygenase [Lentzea pudingi]|uniref:Monooxygenase n=1 Tax=Lentzea pudingi TaxID=1789439 RepID=A0ABQ2I200_9PSEU|nr:flavin reductase family protein [Lentzea pudingi]GGM94895.1 monooxygenase [Lentzea pudingi]
MTLDSSDFRRVLSHFCSGIVVVTAVHDGDPVGLTCQSFTSLSISPPLVSFAVARTSSSWARIRAAQRFAVNILGEHQQHVSRSFSASGTDKFAGHSWRTGPLGSPLLDGAIAHVDCELHAVHEGGDHDIVVGAVHQVIENPAAGRPLLYFRSAYHVLRDEHPPAA